MASLACGKRWERSPRRIGYTVDASPEAFVKTAAGKHVQSILVVWRRTASQDHWARKLFFFFWADSPRRAMVASFTRFLYHTQRRTTVGRTPVDE